MPYWFDGNNLIGQSAAAARQDRRTRRAFLYLLSTLSRERGGSFTVYFDGDDPGGSLPPKGVRVRYSAPFSTDDAILQQAMGTRNPSEIIVVTNDQGLAARCRNAGVKTMDWRQFTTRMNSPVGPASKSSPKDEKVNLDEWSRYFGLEPDDLK